jgi:heme-degrading monooxygenase HmoA
MNFSANARSSVTGELRQLGLIEGGNPMQMRIAFFPAEERVAELSEDVVQEQLLGTLKAIPGFTGAYFCLDHPSGRAVSVTLWETEDALTTSERAVGEVAQAASEVRIPNPSSVETFEVVYRA